MTPRWKIHFKINSWRKYKKSNFKADISEYWENKFEDMFRGW